MDENNTPSEPTPAPEPEVPATPPTPTPAPVPDPAAGQASYPRDPMMGGKGPVPFSGAPDPSLPADVKQQAMLVWILSFFTSFIGPLIFLLISKDKPFVYHHAAQCLTISIVTAVLWVVAFATCVGLILMPFVGIAVLVFAIMGAIAANAGSRFEPPLFSNVCKALFNT